MCQLSTYMPGRQASADRRCNETLERRNAVCRRLSDHLTEHVKAFTLSLLSPSRMFTIIAHRRASHYLFCYRKHNRNCIEDDDGDVSLTDLVIVRD